MLSLPYHNFIVIFIFVVIFIFLVIFQFFFFVVLFKSLRRYFSRLSCQPHPWYRQLASALVLPFSILRQVVWPQPRPLLYPWVLWIRRLYVFYDTIRFLIWRWAMSSGRLGERKNTYAAYGENSETRRMQHVFWTITRCPVIFTVKGHLLDRKANRRWFQKDKLVGICTSYFFYQKEFARNVKDDFVLFNSAFLKYNLLDTNILH